MSFIHEKIKHGGRNASKSKYVAKKYNTNILKKLGSRSGLSKSRFIYYCRWANQNINTYSVLTVKAWDNPLPSQQLLHMETNCSWSMKYFLERQGFIILAVMCSTELNILRNVRVFVVQQFQLYCQLDYHSSVLASAAFSVWEYLIADFMVAR